MGGARKSEIYGKGSSDALNVFSFSDDDYDLYT